MFLILESKLLIMKLLNRNFTFTISQVFHPIVESYNTALIHHEKPFNITYKDGSSVKGHIYSANVTVSGTKN